ncbi:hypothetical protein [Streptomyces sp. NPDC002758]
MDERRDPKPSDGSRAPIVAAASRLSPIQESWAVFVRHVTVTCARCRDIDQTNCDDATRLYRAWQALTADAAHRLNEA